MPQIVSAEAREGHDLEICGDSRKHERHSLPKYRVEPKDLKH